MNIKKLLVSFVAIASVLLSVLFLVASVSAASFSNVEVTVDSIDAGDNPGVVAGDLVTLKVFFTSDVDSSDIKIKAEIEGEKTDVSEVTKSFEVESGHRYMKVMTLKVPYELKDQVSDDADLNIKIWGGDTVSYTTSYPLRVQRPSYDVAFMSISTNQKIEAGELFPVDIVLKNVGYNKLDDLYVTVKVPELNVQKTAFFGDLVPVEDDDHDDTVRGRLFLQMPYDAKTGLYTLEVEVKNSDLNMNGVEKISVENGFTGNLIVSGNELVVVNPTNKLMVLRLVPETTDGSVSLSQDLVSVPAGSSKTVEVASSGSAEYTVNAFTMDGRLVDTATIKSSNQEANNAIVVLTAVLAIIFLVLLVVLVVLVTKKPQKQEDFGESYY